MIETLTPILGAAAPSFLGRTAASLVARKLGKALTGRNERKKAEDAYRQAIQAWLVALLRNLEALALDEEEIRLFFADYIAALERFLTDEVVSEELLRPFSEDTPEPRLDHTKLLVRWQALGLPDLPQEFNAAGACRAYVKELNRQRVVTEELRAQHQAQIQEHQRALLEQLVGPRTALDLAQYATAARQRYQTLDLTALTPAGRDDPDAAPLRLRDVFIPQNARRSRPVHTLPRDYLLRQGLEPDTDVARAALQERWRKAKPEPSLDILTAEDAQHSVLLGDPGAGKSSLARYILLSLLDEAPAAVGDLLPWRERLRGHLPILVELRRYIAREAEGKCKGFLGYLDYLGQDQGFALNANDLDMLLAGQPTLVIFDGLDEIFDPKVRERIAREVTGFALRYPSARVLVTSRIMGFDARPFEEASFAVFTLDDLDNKQIEAFSEGWFRIAFANRPDEASLRHRHVMDALGQRPAIRALAGNPLLLTIIAIIARHEQLPHSRVGLYEHALKVLCHNWDLRRRVEVAEDSQLRDLEADHKLTLLRRVAWRMQEGAGLKANVIEEKHLRVTIEDYFDSEWHFDKRTRARCSREMIEVLQTRNYILCPQGPDLFGFIHRTFLEYLCAAHLLWRFKESHDLTQQELQNDFVLPHVADDSWHEIIRLLTAQLLPGHATPIIKALTPAPEEARSEFRRLALAFDCIGEREPRELDHFRPACDRLLDGFYQCCASWPQQHDPSLREFFAIADTFRAVGAFWPAPALYRRGLPPAPADDKFLASDIYAFLVSILTQTIWSKLPETAPLLLDRARADEHEIVRRAALQALAEHFRDDPETKPLLLDRARADDHASVRAAALQALAQHFRDEPETKPLLLDRARADDHASVRAAALQALAQHFRDEPETKPLLLDRARADDHASVRAAALQALAQHFRDEPETKPLLLDRARADEHASVRHAALQALAQHFRDEPETKPLLLDRARADEHASVRHAALQALAQHFRDEPETKPLLLDRARADDHESVRRAALQALAQHFRDDPETKPLLLDRARARADEHESVRRAALQALAQHFRDDPETKPLLLDRARADDRETVRSAALQALAQHFRDEPETKPLLLDRARADEHASVRHAALQALAQHFRDDPETKPLLLDRARARADEHESVRRAALQALAQHFRDDPETKPLLLDRARADDRETVRSAALQALAQHFRDEPETKPLLLDRARADEHASVRHAALQALAQHFRDEPETKPLLLDRARADEHESVRRAALCRWGMTYGSGPDAVLLSRDLDGVEPGLDPSDPIDLHRVQKAASKLGMVEDEVRRVYDRLAEQVPLRLAWREDSENPD